MDQKEIVESYKRLERKIEKTAWSAFIGCVLFAVIIVIIASRPNISDRDFKSIVGVCAMGAVFIPCVVAAFLSRIYFSAEQEEEWGMSITGIEAIVSAERKKNEEKRKAYKEAYARFESVSLRYILPYLQYFCRLNVGARKEQEIFLTDYYTDQIIPMVFERDYTDAQRNEALQYWLKKELADRKDMMEILFKLTIVEDGIRNNEWNLLIQIMTQLNFNNYYIDYFKKRYAPLRTEFDAYQRSSGASAASHSFSYLKPYYAVLGLQEGATDEEIKRAYHELALQHHPDLPKNAGCVKECEAMMAKINLAYEKVMG